MVTEKTFLRSSVIIVIRRTTIPGIASSQQTNCNLDNFYVGN